MDALNAFPRRGVAHRPDVIFPLVGDASERLAYAALVLLALEVDQEGQQGKSKCDGAPPIDLIDGDQLCELLKSLKLRPMASARPASPIWVRFGRVQVVLFCSGWDRKWLRLVIPGPRPLAPDYAPHIKYVASTPFGRIIKPSIDGVEHDRQCRRCHLHRRTDGAQAHRRAAEPLPRAGRISLKVRPACSSHPLLSRFFTRTAKSCSNRSLEVK